MVETLNPPKAPKYQADPRLLEARVKLAAHLGLPPDDITITIGPKDKGPNSYSTPLESTSSTPDAPTEEVHITIHKQGLDIEPDRIREELRNSLAQVKPIADVAQMVPEVKLATKLVADLKEATKGTKFNQKLFEWPGFSTEVAKHHVSVNDYALEDVRSRAYGIEMNLRFPVAHNGENTESMQKFSEVTKGRFEAIREILTDRVLKYDGENLAHRGLNGEETSHIKNQIKATGNQDEKLIGDKIDATLAEIKQKIRPTTPNVKPMKWSDIKKELEAKGPIEAAVVAKLDANIQASEKLVRKQMAELKFNIASHNNRLSVTIRSPEQEAAYKEAEKTDHMYRDPAEGADALRNSNPLTSLVVGLSRESIPATDTTPEISPQLHKALGRSFLFDKNKNPIPDFALIAGRKDIQAAIATEMMKVLPEHPERKDQFAAMLNSNIFKQHELWHGSSIGQADTAKPYPFFEKVAGENDTVDISFSVRKDADPAKNQLKHLIEGLAGHVQTPPAAQAPAAAPVPVAPAAQAPVAAPAQAAPAPVQAAAPVTPEQTEAERQNRADVYKNIARDIISLHKAKNPDQSWVNRAQDESKDQGRPGPG